MSLLQSLASSVSILFSSDPAVFALQVGAVAVSAIVIYTVLFTTRDILIRSSSTVAQVGSILLVAAFPIVGFFLYLLVRPSRTLYEKALRKDLNEIVVRLREMQKKGAPLKILKKPSALPLKRKLLASEHSELEETADTPVSA